MDGIRWYHIPLLIAAVLFQLLENAWKRVKRAFASE